MGLDHFADSWASTNRPNLGFLAKCWDPTNWPNLEHFVESCASPNRPNLGHLADIPVQNRILDRLVNRLAASWNPTNRPNLGNLAKCWDPTNWPNLEHFVESWASTNRPNLGHLADIPAQNRMLDRLVNRLATSWSQTNW